MKTAELYIVIDRIIASQKEARQNNDYNTILLNAEALLEYSQHLIVEMVDKEAEYRKFEAKLSNEKDENGKRNSSAYCETQAKATDFYKEWQQAKHMLDLVYELVNIAKKLAGSVDHELKAL